MNLGQWRTMQNLTWVSLALAPAFLLHQCSCELSKTFSYLFSEFSSLIFLLVWQWCISFLCASWLQNKQGKTPAFPTLISRNFWKRIRCHWFPIWYCFPLAEHKCFTYFDTMNITLLLCWIPWWMQFNIVFPAKKSLWWRKNLKPKSTSMSKFLLSLGLFFMKSSRIQGRSSWLKANPSF